jgi:hypothetical protein
VVILAPVVVVPPELQDIVQVVEYSPPNRNRLLHPIASHARGGFYSDEELKAICNAALGLAGQQAERAFANSLALAGRITPELVWQLKAEAIANSGYMTRFGFLNLALF